ncbi:hypothetical protein IV500_10365 [Paeniglutamicibacter antarcticus]|uniref:Uncharacterized protein n=1 Tax=Arthrobacter terrae TaxID=2935737 RepID=A0A931CK47_9MICC|nr:hypothetical protein [Arthrobacter terrae]MBG0739788.1 hypothetical protein [Arthrobacter terrae]
MRICRGLLRRLLRIHGRLLRWLLTGPRLTRTAGLLLARLLLLARPVLSWLFRRVAWTALPVTPISAFRLHAV